MTGIGHNGGPTMQPGHGFRRVAWEKSRAALLPSLPLEIVRIRVARAKRLGLPYRTYATIRATSGHDIVAFLFSGNALDLRPGRAAPPSPIAERLEGLRDASERLAAIHAPLSPESVLRESGAIDASVQAPDILSSWSETRRRLRGFVRARGLPPDGVVLVPATALEREWCGAAGLAGSVAAADFFAARD